MDYDDRWERMAAMFSEIEQAHVAALR